MNLNYIFGLIVAYIIGILIGFSFKIIITKPDFIGDNPKEMEEGTICPLKEKSFEEQEKEITKRFKKGMNINVEEKE